MCSSKYITRSLTEIPLIGQPIAELKCSTLPTNGEVLKYFFYIKNNSQHYSQLQGKGKLEGMQAKMVVNHVAIFWEKCNLPMCDKDYAKRKVINLYKDWASLNKHYRRLKLESPAYMKSIDIFKEKLEKLFDVAHPQNEKKTVGIFG